MKPRPREHHLDSSFATSRTTEYTHSSTPENTTGAYSHRSLPMISEGPLNVPSPPLLVLVEYKGFSEVPPHCSLQP